MKILQINKFFYMKGGSERYFFDVSSALEKDGHEVIHFSMQDEKNIPSPYSKYFIDHIDFQGEKSLSKAAHFLYSTEAQKKLTQLLADHKPDIAHLHNIAHQLTPSIIDTLRKANIPIVQTLHDYQLICPNYQLFTQGSPCQRCKQHQYWKAIQYKCVQNSKSASALSALEMSIHTIVKQTYKRGVSRFIAPSKFLHTLLQEWGWNESQLAYIPHFVEKRRSATTARKKMVLYAGRLTTEKGVHVLPDIAKKISQDIEIVVAGTGPEESALKERIQKEHITNCRLVGFQTEHQMSSLMQEAAAVIMPSLWYENAPMVVYEAFAVHTPVIASRIGGLPELISEGKNGYLCEPGSVHEFANAIEKTIQGGLPTIGPNRYTTKKHLEQLMTVYEQLV